VLLSIRLCRRHFAEQRKLPIVGLSAYLISIYFWLIGRLDPALLLLIPMFHSLQYLAIVARLERNRSSGSTKPWLRVLAFYLSCVVVGYFGFWLLPEWLNGFSVFQADALSVAAVSTFSIWVFINIHHYFIDNVIWRKENPETARWLFAAPRQ
jgi:hypothetical protein